MVWDRREIIDESTGAQIPVVVQIDIDHAMIHEGRAFTHSELHTGVAAAGVSDHLIVTGANEAHLRQLRFECSGSPVNLEYYENTVTSADGSSDSLGNNNRTSDKVSTILLYSAPTITDVGDQMGATLIPAVTNQGGGVGILSGGEWVLAANSKYLIRLINNDNSAIDYTVTMFFLEPDLK